MLFILLVGGFLFYWFAILPGQIRIFCENYAGSKADNSYGRGKQNLNNLYRQCLVQNGMSPESIFVNLQ